MGSVLYGVTMQEPGVSKLVSVRWEGDRSSEEAHGTRHLQRKSADVNQNFHDTGGFGGSLFSWPPICRAARLRSNFNCEFAVQIFLVISFSDFFHRRSLTRLRAALECSHFLQGKVIACLRCGHASSARNKFRRYCTRRTRQSARHLRSRRQAVDRRVPTGLSAFDVVLPTGIPDKGRVLTQLSLFWFDLLRYVIPNHVISATEFPSPFDAHKDELAGRSMVVRKTQPLPIECVVRGYVSGSGWKDYRVTGKICGIDLPNGLVESDRLPEPIFTPATKAATGHDENISFDEAAKMIGRELAETVREVSLDDLQARHGIRRAPRHYPRRYEIRIRPAQKFRRRRRTNLDRRSPDARLLSLLASRTLRARRPTALLRQTVCTRLS